MDRRKDRRQHARYLVGWPCTWHSSDESGKGHIIDFSLAGCFLWTGHVPVKGDVVQIRVVFSPDTVLNGTVVYRLSPFGFAVAFSGNADTAAMMKWLSFQYGPLRGVRRL